jgi:DNA-binding CsgD family transcriptional regulator
MASAAGQHARPTEQLTSREREVLNLIAVGYETKEIAGNLSISPETVRTHVRNSMSKLGARTRAQLVAIAFCPEEALAVARAR